MRAGIAGGGLLGRLTAWRLLRAGWQVDIHEAGLPGEEPGACWVAAGMLAPWSEAASGHHEILDAALTGLGCWPRWLAELYQDSGVQVALNRGGTLVLAHRHDLPLFRHFRQRLHSLGAPCRDINAADLAAAMPGLNAGFREALLLPDEAAVDNRSLLDALDIAVAKLGGSRRHGSRVSAVHEGLLQWQRGDKCGEDRYKQVFDCRGLGARGELPDLRGVRGEILRVHAPEVTLDCSVRLMHPRYQLYISPRPGQHYVVGATEIESDSAAAVTVRSAMELMSALYTVHSGFAEATLESAEARCRPALPDNLPRVESARGVVRLNGAYRHGYLLAPAMVGQALALLAAGDIHSEGVSGL